MWFGWLVGCCYVVWVVTGPLLCGVGVARVLLCGLSGCWAVAMWRGCC